MHTYEVLANSGEVSILFRSRCLDTVEPGLSSTDTCQPLTPVPYLNW